MKKFILMALVSLFCVSCFEKDLPEGLTEDNFYLGTFEFQFADKQEPSIKLELTKEVFRIYYDNKLFFEDDKFNNKFDEITNETTINETGLRYERDFTNAKYFDFNIMSDLIPQLNRYIVFVISGRESSLTAYYQIFKSEEEAEKKVFFCTDPDDLDDLTDLGIRAEVFIWNGKKYKLYQEK